jgi:hypothetical protein
MESHQLRGNFSHAEEIETKSGTMMCLPLAAASSLMRGFGALTRLLLS